MQSTQTVNSAAAPPVSKRSAFGGVATFVTIAFAAVLIGWGDRLLRRDEDLLAVFKKEEAPVFLPFSEYLRDEVALKSSWNSLQATLDSADAKNNQKLFTSATYEISKFVSQHLSPTDERRRKVLTNLIARYGDSPETIPAYMELLSSEWRAQLAPNYPAYAHKVLSLTNSPSTDNMGIDMGLASQLEADKQPGLQLEALRQVYRLYPVGSFTADAMKQLLALMTPSDPDRPALQAALAKYQTWTEQVAADLEWYRKFQEAINKGSLAAAESVRASAPPSLLPTFSAAADAALAVTYARAGRYADADRLRKSLADDDLGGLDDVAALVSNILMPPTTAPVKRSQSLMGIDSLGIYAQRWRGLLLSGRFAEAAALAKIAFPTTSRLLRRGSDEMLAVSQGNFTRLSPVATLRPRSGDLPPEMRGASNVYGGTFALVPTGKAIPADIHSHVELWISSDLIVAECTADEPRNPLPPATTKKPNGPVSRDESFELSFNPDRWFDFDYQIDANSAGVVWAARMDMTGSKTQTHVLPEIGAKATAAKTPSGWKVRMVLQRKLLIRPGPSLLRFNARRFRYVQEHGQSIRQIYSWSPTNSGDRQPERWGWLIVPGSETQDQTSFEP